MKKSVVVVLERARALILKGWTKHAMARLPNGQPCRVEHPDAATFDLNGAVVRASMRGPAFAPAMEALAAACYPHTAIRRNDMATDAVEAAAVLDRAIQEAQK